MKIYIKNDQLIVATLPVTHLSQNASVVCCLQSKTAAIFDPGGSEQELLNFAQEQGCQLTHILLTHGHLDHCAHAKKLSVLANVNITGPHLADKVLFDTMDLQGQWLNFTGLETFYPDNYLEDDEKIQVGELSFTACWTPGHSPGHLIFVNEAHNFTIAGDLVFKNSVGRTDLLQSDPGALIESIRKHVLNLDEKMILFPGHGGTTTVGAEKRSNPFFKAWFS